MDKYIFHTDPGHGWLAVPMAELEAMPEVRKAISDCSYVSNDGQTAYLEEDCDAVIFLYAKSKAGIVTQQVDQYREFSPIRNLASFPSAPEYAIYQADMLRKACVWFLPSNIESRAHGQAS